MIERINNGDKKPSSDEDASDDGGDEESETAEAEAAEDDAPGTPERPADRPAVWADRLAASGPTVSIVNATVHTVSGETIEGGTVSFREGRIVAVGRGLEPLDGAEVVDATGLHLYPGIIDANTAVGLTEISSVAASVDVSEVGDVNPNVNTALAINPDSEYIPVTRANGLTHVVAAPSGGLVSGSSSLIRLDGWTWEDLTAATPVAMHVRWPSFRIRRRSFFGPPPSAEDQKKQREERLERIADLFESARAYAKVKASSDANELEVNPRLEAMLPVLDGTLPVVIHASEIRQLESAIEWAEKEGIRFTLAGSGDLWRIADTLRAKQIPVILTSVLSLPSRRDEPYDTAYTEAAKLAEAGVRFCFASNGSTFGAAAVRHLPYHAAMAVAFGLPHDAAIRALTLSPAEILGVSAELGSIEEGKSASLMLVDGDPLEIRTQVKALFIDGRPVEPTENRHFSLYEKYAARPR